MILEFEKEENGGWYIVLPDWPGSHSALAMVAGADTLLDTLDNGSGWVTLQVDTKPLSIFRRGYTLRKIVNCFGGATYWVRSKKYTGPAWLCEVTKFVFNNTLPKRIYFKEI